VLKAYSRWKSKNMMQVTKKQLTLQDFLALPASDSAYELVNGEAIPKMSPKYFHSQTQRRLLLLFDPWCQGKGRICPEWAIVLQRQGIDWCPVPDLTYISYDRLSADWHEDSACPVPPELVIEIISPDQTFGEMSKKATDYLEAGILRVWVVDPRARSITVFYPDSPPRTYTRSAVVVDPLFDGLEVIPDRVFL
jgi:Uma2 family endonuclease